MAGECRESEEVFSLARKVQGGDFGYIEVQYATDELKDIFEIPDSDIKVVAFLPGGEILYHSEGLTDDLVSYIKKHPEVTKRILLPFLQTQACGHQHQRYPIIMGFVWLPWRKKQRSLRG